MVGDDCEGVPAVVENCVWLFVADPVEVGVDVRVYGYCDVWPAVVDSEG